MKQKPSGNSELRQGIERGRLVPRASKSGFNQARKPEPPTSSSKDAVVPAQPFLQGDSKFRPGLYGGKAADLEGASSRYAKELNVNRKLIRPSLSDIQDQMGPRPQRKKPTPPDQTNAESFYYIKQMQARTPMAVVLTTGEVIRGVIEWYDKGCIKVHRAGEPNLLIMKNSIRYMHKQSDSKNGNNDGNFVPPVFDND